MTDTSHPPGLTRTVARGAGVAGLGGVAVQLVTLLTYIFLARLAPPAVFGTFAAASILVAAGTIFVESGMTAALIQRRDRFEEAASTAFASTILGGMGLSAISAALAPVVGAFFGSSQVTAVAFAVSGLHVINATTVVPDALLQRRFAYVRRLIVDPIWLGTYGGTAAVGLALGLGVWALALATYTSAVVKAILVWSFVRWRPQRRLMSFALWRELAAFARHVLASEILRHLGGLTQTAGIGRVLGAPDLAQFNFGSRIATQAGFPVITASAYVLFPAFARISSDPNRMRHAFHDSLSALTFLAAPISLAFLPFGHALAVLLLGPRWAPAGDVLTSLCLFGLALALISISSEVFKAVGRPDLLPRMHALSTISSVSAVVVGVMFGIVVVGGFMSVGSLLVASFGLFAACRATDLPRRQCLDAVLRPVAVAAAIALLFVPVEHVLVQAESRRLAIGLILLITEAVVAAVLYFLLMRLVAPQATERVLASVAHLRGRSGSAMAVERPER